MTREKLALALGISSQPKQPADEIVGAYRDALEASWAAMARLLGDDGARAVLGYAVKRSGTVVPFRAHDDSNPLPSDPATVLSSSEAAGPDEAVAYLEAICVQVLDILKELTGELITEPLLVELKRHSDDRAKGDIGQVP